MYQNPYLLSKKLGELLKERGMTLAVAESCTGGGLAELITAVPGSSAYFDRGFVTYSNAAKEELLGVDPKVIEAYGAVSKEVAYAMAAGAIRHSHADLAISITGIAGPGGGTPEKPVGTVWVGLSFRKGQCECRKQVFSSGRKHIRMSTLSFALEWLLQEIERLRSEIS